MHRGVVDLALAGEVGIDHLANGGGAVGEAPQLGRHATRPQVLHQLLALRALARAIGALEHDEGAPGLLLGRHGGAGEAAGREVGGGGA